MWFRCILCLRVLKRALQTQFLCWIMRSNILWSSRCETRRTTTFYTRALWMRNKFLLTGLINWQNASNPSVLSTGWAPRLTFQSKCFFSQVRFQERKKERANNFITIRSVLNNSGKWSTWRLSESTCFPTVPKCRKSIAFWKIPRLCPFVFQESATCRSKR